MTAVIRKTITLKDVFFAKGITALLFTSLLSCIFIAPAIAQTPANASSFHVNDELRSKLLNVISNATSFEDRFDAEVWLVQKSHVLKKYVKDDSQRLSLLKNIHQTATQLDLPPEFVLAVIEVESHFDQFAVSRVGAQGMMQIMPFWKHEIGRESDNLMDIETNLKYGCTILKHYLDKAKGNWSEALARYNGSYGRLDYPRKVMDAWAQHWR